MTEGAFHHRATLKQNNKSFKSRHATKSALKERAKGKIHRESPKSTNNVALNAAQKRVNRRNLAKQTQVNKRHALANASRLFNGVDGAPRIVAVIPLSPDLEAKRAVQTLMEALGGDARGEGDESGVWKCKVERFKTSLQFILLPYGSFYQALDCAKAADYTMLLLSSSVEVDKWGDTLLRTLQAQGFPSTLTCLSPSAVPNKDSVKEQQAIQKSLLSFIQYFIPSQSRVYNLLSSSSSDALNAARALCEGKPSDVRWRDGRSYILVEGISWAPSEPSENEGKVGTMKITGVVRGALMSANRLVHLPNFGDFRVSKIMSATLPRSKTKHHIVDMDNEPTETILSERTSGADDLISTNDADDLEMGNEQTWPTDEDMEAAKGSGMDTHSLPDAKTGTTPKVVKRVPKGTSAYQAAWIIDDEEEDDEGEGDDSGDEGSDAAMSDGEIDGESNHPNGVDDEEEEDMEDLELDASTGLETASTKKTVQFEDMDMEEEAQQLDSWRKRSREEQEDNAFPDEIDTPQNQPALERFARYRGLKSFRTSPWDPYENLPREYGRIFQFEDWKRSERSVLKQGKEGGDGWIEPGTRVCIHVENTPCPPPDVLDMRSPLVVFGLLQHEHKVTVQNFKVMRDTGDEEVVKSKDPLILCVGPRRFNINPIFSQHTRGGGKGVNKYERFLRHGSAMVASVYAPITFGKQSCCLLRESASGEAPTLVATGTFMNPDTTRIVSKRLILTGHPFKVHKRTATVRYMFFNRDDISYFAPIQLHTKYGRTGHIREPLGTHGYFKAHFDGPVTQMDTICMALYKRVYPKWASMWVQKDKVQGRDQEMLADGRDVMEE